MSEFRKRLIDLEPMSEERNQKLREEIKIMFEPKLTRFEMVYWGLSVAGEAGVAHVLDIYRREIDRVMGLCGLARIADIGPDLIFRRR